MLQRVVFVNGKTYSRLGRGAWYEMTEDFKISRRVGYKLPIHYEIPLVTL